jgi:hypothetical protein
MAPSFMITRKFFARIIEAFVQLVSHSTVGARTRAQPYNNHDHDMLQKFIFQPEIVGLEKAATARMGDDFQPSMPTHAAHPDANYQLR